MNTKPPPDIHFPTSQEKGAVPFPSSQHSGTQQQDRGNGAPAEQPAQDEQRADNEEEPAEPELSAEELRLMADTMPGDGPGD
jgi:hypothetical protein